MDEIWKDISGYEGLYRISNMGNVFSCRMGRNMKPRPNSAGYLRISLKKDGVVKRQFVHRLVAIHFVKNPDESKNCIVNHLDCNYLNNKYDNLEWTTMKGNTRYAMRLGRMDRTATWIERLHKTQSKNYKAVEGYDSNTGEVVEFFDAVNHVKVKGYCPASVCNCCKGKQKTHKMLAWRYKEDKK